MAAAILQEMGSVGFFLLRAVHAASGLSEAGTAASVVAVVLAVFSCAAVMYVGWWKPLAVKARLEAQGLRGPPYRFLYGNVAEMREMSKAAEAQSASPSSSFGHLLLLRLLPHYAQWAPRFGSSFLYFLGPAPRLALAHPDLCRHVLANRAGHFPKPAMRSELRNLLGNGLGTLEGSTWAHHRRIVSPSFLPDRLRAIVPTVSSLSLAMARRWQARLQATGLPSIEIDVHQEFRALTADVVAHATVGSRYAPGVTPVFDLQRRQQLLFSPFGVSPVIPGSRFFPTPTNLRRWELRRQIASTIRSMLQARFATSVLHRGAAANSKHASPLPDDTHDIYGPDLLGLLMAAHAKEPPDTPKNLRIDMQGIMDEVQTFFFAGHETTTTMLTWTIMLLAIHQEWQDKAREEVLAICGKKDEIDAEALIHLKVVGMIMNESLRLYPPATAILREASQETKLGDMLVPKGTTIFIPVIALHVDPNYWGADAHEFNPQRFADGILKACKNPSAYLPFGAGPRICVGQNFALMEAKIALSTILRHFRFTLSPLYKHDPCTFLTLQPKHGMHVIFENH